MFSEITPAITNALLASGLIASTMIVSTQSSRPQVFSYEQPLFNCQNGLVLYNRIQQNKTISSTEREELLDTLIGDLPKNCITDPIVGK